MYENLPKNCPWQVKSDVDKTWTLSKNGDIFKFKRSKLDKNYVFVKKNNEETQTLSNYDASFAYQRLFDSGYELDLLWEN